MQSISLAFLFLEDETSKYTENETFLRLRGSTFARHASRFCLSIAF